MMNSISRVSVGVLLVAALCMGSQAFAADTIVYPSTPRGDVIDDYHGHAVADPYRWLEDSTGPQTTAWLDAETKLSGDLLARLPQRDLTHRRLAALMAYRRVDVPWREAGKIFWLETSGDQPQAVLYTCGKPGDKPRVFFDPNQISPDGSLAMGDYIVAPDGAKLAYRAAQGGADEGRIRVRQMASGQDTDIIDGANACWTRDGAGFFYVRSFPQESGSSTPARAGMQACYHRLGEPPSADREILNWDERARWVYFVVSEDGHYACAVAEEGTVSEVYLIDLKKLWASGAGSPAFEVLDGRNAFHTPVDWVGDTFYLRTELDAPNKRIIALDLRKGAAAEPREIVPASNDVITDAVINGGRLVVNYLSDVHSVVRLFDLNGAPKGEIPLPGIGAVGWPLSARPSTPELFFSFETFLSPATIRAFDTRTGKITEFHRATVKFDAAKYETRQVFYRSKDGTRVPMFITSARNLKLDGSHPVFLTAYGGYGATMEPRFSPDIPFWLEKGGIHVLANIRGGGEYGEDWHLDGMLEKKQNSFDDFIAAAEYLIREGYTVRGKIAIYGKSNGGLLMGAVLTQRPDLFGAVVANAGHYDMLRYHRFTAGAGWVTEYGSADDSTAFNYLRGYSPLQNVRAGTCYPPTLLLAADHDDRVVPAHAYKFAAALQSAQTCDHPILLRVARNASHSYASRDETLAELTDMWSFIMSSLGVSRQ